MNKIVNYEEIEVGQIFRDCYENSMTYGQVFIKVFTNYEHAFCLTGREAGYDFDFDPKYKVLPFTPFNLV